MTLKKLVGLVTVMMCLIVFVLASSVLASSEGVCSISVNDAVLSVSDVIVGQGENASCTATVTADGVLESSGLMSQDGLFYNYSTVYDSSKVYSVGVSCLKGTTYFESYCTSSESKSYAGSFFILLVIIAFVVLLNHFINAFSLERTVATFLFWVVAFGFCFIAASVSLKLLSNTVIFGSALLMFTVFKNVSMVAFFGSVVFALWFGIKKAGEWLRSRR